MKKMLTAAAIALMTAVIFGAGPAQAAVNKVGVGSISNCNMRGSVTFKPALVAGGTANTTINVSLSLSQCSGSGDGATVTGGSMHGTLHATANDCNAVHTNTTGNLTVSYKVKVGSPSLSPTTVSFVQIQNNHSNPVVLQLTGATTSGSFSNLGMFANVNTIRTTACGVSVFKTATTPPSTFSEG